MLYTDALTLLLLVTCAIVTTSRIATNDFLREHPYYHSTESISEELLALKTNCKLKFDIESFALGKKKNLDIVTLSSFSNTTANHHFRMFAIFGEHARELISSESALFFIKKLCNDEKLKLPKTCQDLPQDFTIQIIPNANPISRSKVEMGDYCLRTNENGVDLNRNWGDHWKKAYTKGDDTYPGPQPFSEVETKLIRDQLSAFKPDIFFTVHSGNCAYMTPFAFTFQEPSDVLETQWISILNSLERHGPQCPEGSAARLVRYKSPGTCLDYAFEVVKTPYPFGFEIYKNEDFNMFNTRTTRSTKHINSFTQLHQKSFKQTRPRKPIAPFLSDDMHRSWRKISPHISNSNEFQRLKSSALMERARINNDDQICLQIFNPLTIDSYTKTLEQWNDVSSQVLLFRRKMFRP